MPTTDLRRRRGPKPTAAAALLMRIARETVGAIILTTATVLLWLGLLRIGLAVARAGMRIGEKRG
jgi:spore maturation protein SpmA